MPTYHNLTQNTEGRLVYIRSTDIEQKNWHRLLWSVPDEWLYQMRLGENIEVVDITSNSSGGKIKRIFCPVLADVLNFLFFGHEPVNKRVIQHYQYALTALRADKSLMQKFLFWKGRVKLPVVVFCNPIIVEKEPNPLS